MQTPPLDDLSAWKEFTRQHGQGHVLAFADELTEPRREALLRQLADVEWEQLGGWIRDYVLARPPFVLPEDIGPADFHPLIPRDDRERQLYARADARGWELLRQGKVAAFTVAGGQGTRLGFSGPKGIFPIGPVSGKSLFQWFAESLARFGELAGRPIPWYIMTSPMNDEATRSYFAEHGNFGLGGDQVSFLAQGTMPAFGLDGKLLLGARDSLALSPDGHGGSLKALFRSGAIADMAARGVEQISYFQVDNPLVSVVSPRFLGLHDLAGAEMSNRSLSKTGPFEKIGAFCRTGGKLIIVEYSDLPKELATETGADGRLRYLAGSPAIHAIRRDFVERLNSRGTFRLPFHRADKKVPCIDANGELVVPEKENGVKLETFVFDALQLASRAIVVEAAREDEFAPVKNPTGVDSVESSRRLVQERFARWLASRGIAVPRDAAGELACRLEISPRRYVTMDDFQQAPVDGLTVRAGQDYHYL